MRRKLILTAIISSFALGACGVKGELKTPPPMWGDKSKTKPADKPQEEAPAEENSSGN